MKIIKNLLFWLAVLLPFSVFVFAEEFGFYAEVAWWALTFVLLVKPAAMVLSRFKFLMRLVTFRREIGILAGTMALAHFVGYLIMNDFHLIEYILTPRSWNLGSFLGWGLLGVVVVVPLLLTSNKWSMIKLGKWWKVLHKLTYLFFVFGGVHIYMQGEEYALISALLVAAFWLLAKFKVRL